MPIYQGFVRLKTRSSSGMMQGTFRDHKNFLMLTF